MRRAVIWLVLLAAIGGGLWFTYSRTTPDETEAKREFGRPVPVLTVRAARQDVPVYLDALGTVQAFNTVTVRSMIDGPLSDIDFREGQDVAAGAVLAHIDPRPYQATLDQAVAKKAQDEATLANARLDLQRYNKLVATNYTSGQTADTQRALVAQDEALVKQDQASIDSARTQLSYTTIAAPLAGRTGIRQVDQGNIIHASDANGLVVITQLQPISVVFTLPQQALPAVAAAMQAGDARVLALPQGDMGATDAGTDEAAGPGLSDPDAAAPATQAATAPAVLDRGTLAVLDNEVDSSTGTIKLKATFPNAALRLWPGGFVNIRLRVQTLQNVVTVPPAAIQRGPDGSFVYVVAAESKARRRTVTVGHEDANVSVVTAGLQPGEQVITDGAARVTDGKAVTVAAPETPPTPAIPRRRPREGTPAAAVPAKDGGT
jgi:multidrug efflux system membrane fusion protein